jgi:hypothetical protein
VGLTCGIGFHDNKQGGCMGLWTGIIDCICDQIGSSVKHIKKNPVKSAFKAGLIAAKLIDTTSLSGIVSNKTSNFVDALNLSGFDDQCPYCGGYANPTEEDVHICVCWVKKGFGLWSKK